MKKKHVVWFAKGAGIARAGPFSDAIRAAEAMTLINGEKPTGFAIWPEVMRDRNSRRYL